MTVSEATPAAETAQKRSVQKVGRVVSDKMNKTVVVSVGYVRSHPIYKKRIRKSSRFVAHDEQNACKIGDLVRIEEIRPLSKRKRWIVREIVERGVEI